MSDTIRPLIVGIGGTVRAGSTSERALRAALASARQGGAATEIIAGGALNLPIYEPGNPVRNPSAIALVDALRRADGIIVSTPSYHGSISGFVKNALDYAEDLRNDVRPYFDGRAVGCIACAEGPQALGSTIASLRSIVHALRGWPTPFAAAINSRTDPFAADARAGSAEIERGLELVARQVVWFARMHRHYQSVAASEPDLKMASHSVLRDSRRADDPATIDDVDSDLTKIYGFISS
jgi:FMN reductase